MICVCLGAKPLTYSQVGYLHRLQGLTVFLTVVAGQRTSVPFLRNRPVLVSRTRGPAAFLAIMHLTLLDIMCIAYLRITQAESVGYQIYRFTEIRTRNIPDFDRYQ